MAFLGTLLDMPRNIMNDVHNSRLNDAKFNYQKQQDLIQQEREDTAFQRQAADAAAVGINPLSLNGSGAQSSSGSAGMVSSTPLPESNSFAQAFASMVSEIEQMRTGNANRDLLQAEAAKTQAETARQLLENYNYAEDRDLDREVKTETLNNLKSSTSKLDSERSAIDFALDEDKKDSQNGFNRNMTEAERIVTMLENAARAGKLNSFGTDKEIQSQIYRTYMDSGLKYQGVDLRSLKEFINTFKDEKVDGLLDMLGTNSSEFKKSHPVLARLFGIK